MNQMIKIYGADWCGDTRAALAVLNSRRVPYKYLNVDLDDSAAEWVKRHNGGKQKLPTLEIEGRVLSMPNERELEFALRSSGLMA